MASTYLTKTLGTPTNNKKFTFSCWVKKSGTTGTMDIFHAGASGSDEAIMCRFESNGQLTLKHDVGNSQEMLKQTTALYRDTNAWYHVVTVFDTDNSTAEDRQRIYVNGERITDWASSDNFAGGEDILANKAVSHTIGKRNFDSANYLDGVLSHVHFCDGQAYDASYFGSTDSTTGEWKINTSPSVTYGNNGFFILKDGNSVTDQSGQGNNWTVSGGTLTKTEDNPSNVFCTLNPLHLADTNMSVTYSFGNTKYAGNSNHWQRAYGTIGANTGKFFYEFKVLNTSGTSDQLRVGWDSIDSINNGTDNYYSGLTIDTAGKLRGGEDGYNNYDPNAVQMTAAHSGGNFSFTTGDILGMAIDIDNNTFSVYKNGNLEINAYSYASASNCSLLKSKGHFIAPSVNWYSTSGNANRSCFNFGNGYFETTAISSAGTNASGLGLFEYDVPANYTSWSTKGLNE